MIVRVAIAIILWFLPTVLNAQDGARLALVIGNQAYSAKIGSLKNPHNDVTLIEASLKRLGFKLTVIKDASHKAMDSALKRYVTEVRRAGRNALSFFYYSGHGVANPETQINYLIPVDVTDVDDDKVWFESLQQNLIIDMLSKQAPNATHYVVFDACRNELNLTGTAAKALGTDKGFVPITDTAGLLIAYATAPRKTASDVGDNGGPYAKILAEELVKPGVEAVTMFRNVQLKVKQTIGQDPWLSFPSLPAVYLAGRGATDDRLREKQVEAAFWESAKINGGATLLSAYIERYPNGTHISLARTLMLDLERKQAEETAQLARAEQAREAARIAAEVTAKAAQLAQADPAKTQQLAAKPPVAKEPSSADAERLKAIEDEVKTALAQALEAEAQLQATLAAAAEARMKAAKLQGPSGTSTLARGIQAELKRVGCFPGEVDQTWTPKASEALARYLRATNKGLPSEGLTEVFLEQLKADPARACPSPCGEGQKIAADGKCVALAPQGPPQAPPVVRNSPGSGEGSCTEGSRNPVCRFIRPSRSF
jgi:hypothetical protein